MLLRVLSLALVVALATFVNATEPSLAELDSSDVGKSYFATHSFQY